MLILTIKKVGVTGGPESLNTALIILHSKAIALNCRKPQRLLPTQSRPSRYRRLRPSCRAYRPPGQAFGQVCTSRRACALASLAAERQPRQFFQLNEYVTSYDRHSLRLTLGHDDGSVHTIHIHKESLNATRILADKTDDESLVVHRSDIDSVKMPSQLPDETCYREFLV